MKNKPSIQKITVRSFITSFILLSLIVLGLLAFGFRFFYKTQLEGQALAVSEVVKAGLIAHMKAGIMNKRKYFLKEIQSTNDIESLKIIRSSEVSRQFGLGGTFEIAADEAKHLSPKVDVKWLNTAETKMKAYIPYIAKKEGALNCLSCHFVKEGTVLGAVEMVFDATPYQKIAFKFLLAILSVIVLFIVLIALNMNRVIREHVSKPLGLIIKDAMHSFRKPEDKVTNTYASKEFEDVSLQFRTFTQEIVKKQELLEVKNRSLRTLNEEIDSTLKKSMFSLGEIESYRSGETKDHTKRVMKMSLLFAKLLGYDEKDQERIGYASSLHDIGKLGISDAILKKKASLEVDEWQEMMKHTKMGYDMLDYSSQTMVKMAQTIAYEHHERFDGTGYPNGLVGEAIHPIARLVGIVDVFDALYNSRSYKKAWDLEAIKEHLKQGRSKHFDPDMVDLFLEHVDLFVAIQGA